MTMDSLVDKPDTISHGEIAYNIVREYICHHCGGFDPQPGNYKCDMCTYCADCGVYRQKTDLVEYDDGEYRCKSCDFECVSCGTVFDRVHKVEVTFSGRVYCLRCYASVKEHVETLDEPDLNFQDSDSCDGASGSEDDYDPPEGCEGCDREYVACVCVL